MRCLHIGRQNAGSRGVRGKAWSGARQALARDERGQSLAEFGILAVALFPVLLGTISFGIAFNNQITLTNAVSNAAQVVMAGPGVVTDPCQAANNALALSGSTLNNSAIYGSNPLSFTLSAYTNTTTPNTVGPYTVVFSGSGAPSCTAEAADLTIGQEVVVSATYGCKLTIYGVNFASNCVLKSQAAEAVQ